MLGKYQYQGKASKHWLPFAKSMLPCLRVSYCVAASISLVGCITSHADHCWWSVRKCLQKTHYAMGPSHYSFATACCYCINLLLQASEHSVLPGVPRMILLCLTCGAFRLKVVGWLNRPATCRFRFWSAHYRLSYCCKNLWKIVIVRVSHAGCTLPVSSTRTGNAASKHAVGYIWLCL